MSTLQVHAHMSSPLPRFAAFTLALLLALSWCVLPAFGQETVTHPAKVYSYGMFGAFAYSPDGTKIALAHSNAVSILNAQTLSRLDTFFTTHYSSLGMRYDGDITSIAYSPDGTRLAVAAGGIASVFNAATGTAVHTIESGNGARVVAYSHNGAYLLTGADGPLDLWNAATGEHIKTFTGHTNTIFSAVFSNDDSQVLTGADDNTAILWNVASGQPIRTLTDHTDGVSSVAFMPDGTTPITASYDRTVRRWNTGGTVVLTVPDRIASLAVNGAYIVAYSIEGSFFLWDSATNQEAGEFMPNPTADSTGNATAVRQVSFSPDGARLLSGSAASAHLRLWDVTEWAKVVKCAGHTDWLTSTAFSPDGTTVLTGSRDKTAILWNAATGAAVRTFSGHTDLVNAVAYSADGTKVITGSRDKTAKIWNAATGAVLYTFAGHTDAVYAVAFSPDGSKALTGSRDNTAKLWNAATGAVLQTYTLPANVDVGSVAFSPDGHRVLLGMYNTAKTWDAGDGSELVTFGDEYTGEVTSVAFSPDGLKALIGYANDTAKIWDSSSGVLLKTLTGHTNNITSVAFSPDGSKALTGSLDFTAKLWDVQTSATLATFVGHTNYVNGVAFSPDGDRVVTASQDNTARITRVEPAIPLASLDLGMKKDWTYLSLASTLSPDGTKILTSAEDNTARLWDANTGALLRTFTGHTNAVTTVAFSPDGTKALTGSSDRNANLWDTATGNLLQPLQRHTGIVKSVKFNHDGTKALTGSMDGSTILWNVSDGAVLRTFSKVNNIFHVYAVAFSPDDARILTAVDGNMAVLWDTATGDQLMSFNQSAFINDVAWSPNGAQVITASSNGTAKLWNPVDGSELHTFGNSAAMPPIYSGSLAAVAFSHDGAKVVTGSNDDRTFRLWDVATARELMRFPSQGAKTVSMSPDGARILTSDGKSAGIVAMWNVDPAAKPSGMPITLSDEVTAYAQTNAYQDYALQLAAGQAGNLVVRLKHAATTTGTWSLVGSANQMPTLATRDWSGHRAGVNDDNEEIVELLVSAPAPGLYNFSAYYANPEGGEPPYYKLECIPVDQYVSGLSAATGSNTGSVNLQLFGLGFAGGVAVQLVNGNDEVVRTITPSAWNPTTLTLSMDLTGLLPGDYSVAVVWPNTTLTVAQTFIVTAGAVGPRLEAHIQVPPEARYERPYTLWLDYANTGDADMPAPLFVISMADVPGVMRLLPKNQWENASVEILGVNPDSDGDAGVLPAGARNRVPVYFIPYQSDVSAAQFNLEQMVADDTPVDWESLGLNMRLPSFTDQAWEALWAKFSDKAGTTWATVLALLDGDATWLAQNGRPTYDVRELLSYELADANGSTGNSPVLDRARDAESPATLLPLAFDRSCAASLDQRLRLGPLGYGWTHSYEYTLQFPAEYRAVVLGPGGSVRPFIQRHYIGVWESYLGDNGILTGSQGGICTITEPDGRSLTFDAQGRLTREAEINGNSVTLSYDGNGRLTQIAHSNGGAFALTYTGNGRIHQLTDQAGQVTTYTYDGPGEHLVSVAAPGGVTTGYGYVTATGPTEHALQSINYPNGVQRSFSYDGQGRLSGTSLNGNAEEIDFTYDGLGFRSVTDSTGAMQQFFHGPAGEILRHRDPLDNISLFEYNGAYRLTRSTQPDGGVDELRHDARSHAVEWLNPLLDSAKAGFTRIMVGGLNYPDRLASVSDPNGNTTAFAYNNLANLTTVTYPDSSSRTFQYSAGGKVPSYTNRRQQNVTCTYNARGQLTGKSYPGGASVSYAYDTAGRLTTATDATGTITITYDARGYLATIQYPSGHGYTYQYNNAGQRMQRVGDDGYTLNYAYDAAGRIASLTDGSGTQLAQYAYDSAGRLSQETRANGTYTTYAYDTNGRIASLTNHAANMDVQSQFEYTYDQNGNPVSMTTPQGTTTYAYDAAGQLTSVAASGGHVTSYEYDAAGNRIGVIANSLPTAYSTNNLNQYTQAGDAQFQYDADGNLSSRTDPSGTTTYQYDAENRLVRVTTPTDGTYDYTYDALGNRTAVTHGTATTRYVHDPYGIANVAAEYDALGELTARYAYGVGLVARQAASGQYAYYAYDAVGHTRQLSDPSGTVVNDYDYDPFGRVLSKTEAVANPFRFVGRYGVADEPTGLLYMKARFYDAGTGHFLSPDPSGYQEGLNLYHYCSNSPILYIDPLGLGNAFLDQMAGYNGPSAQIDPNTGMRVDPNTNLAKLPAPLQIPGKIADSAMRGDVEGVEHWGKITVAIGDVITGSAAGLGHGMHGLAEDLSKIALEHWFEYLFLPHDPNEKVSPRGTGTESERFLPPDAPIPYTVYFENAATAQVPAQTVVVTDPLDDSLDTSTLVITGIAWGDHQVDIPSGALPFHSRETVSDHRPEVGKAWWVDVDVVLEGSTLRCTFTTLDPDTGELPEDVHAGFLPQNDATHRGEGYVMFSIKPDADLDQGTRITNTASIVFDTAAAMNTNEVFNTIGTPQQTNHAPVLTNPGNQNSTKGQTVSLQLSASDQDGNTLTYSAAGLPPTLIVNPGTGLISGTIGNAAQSSYTVNVSVSDGNGGTDSETFTWTVTTAAQTGSLQVTITTDAAVTAGAQWSWNNGATWNDSGAIVNALPVGSVTVSFKELDGWTTPDDQTVTITAGATATATGEYVKNSKGCGCAGGTLEKIAPSRPIPPQRIGDMAVLMLAAALLCTSRRLFIV